MPGPSRTDLDPGKSSRIASGIPVIPAIDGFRAYAILAIVLYHVLLFSGGYLTIAGSVVGELAAVLALGVDALFIISGFVVFLPTVVRGGDFGPIWPYAIRRAARLAPAYLLAITLIYVLIATFPPHSPPNVAAAPAVDLPSFGSYLAHLAFLQTPLLMFDTGFPIGLVIDGPVWTLSLEVGFYLLLPFIARAYYRHPWRGLLIAASISLAWRLLFANFDSIGSFGLEPGSAEAALLVLHSDYQLPAWAFSFGTGMTAAWLFMRLRSTVAADVLRRRASLIQPAALAMVVVTLWLSYHYGIESAFGKELAGTAGIGRRAPFVAFAFTLAVAALILSTAFARPLQQVPWSNRTIRWIADISYGVYLIHFVVLAYLVVTIAPPQSGTLVDFLVWTALATGLSVVYGYLSARFLERPIRRWAHRYGAGVARGRSAALARPHGSEP